MNNNFFSLPEEKQQKIINAGFKVFAHNSYKKSPMTEIADNAGISKSLLFYWFKNKKELYLFLWNRACRITMEYLTKYGCYDPDDLFEMMYRGMKAKVHIMKKYPDMTGFVIKAFYEKDSEIYPEIQKSYSEYFHMKAHNALARVDKSCFAEGVDLQLMYREMYLASEGYLWEIYQCGSELDVDRLEKDFEEMLKFRKKIYLKTVNS